MAARLKLKAQLIVGGGDAEEIALGPGKADLLDAIDRTCSISAAARMLGLSYRRAWLMVDAMNRLFAAPLVETHRGGRGGAQLTAEGAAALADFRALEAALETAAAPAADRLLARIRAPE
jgi:molybdate transport system regulatory protein